MRRFMDAVHILAFTLLIAALVSVIFWVANKTGGIATWFNAMAGWAQAAGGILAVVAAFMIAQQQAREERDRREQSRRFALKTLREAVEFGLNLLIAAKDRLGGPGDVTKATFAAHYAPDSFEAVIETLRAAPMYDLGMYEVSIKLIEFRLVLAEAKTKLDETVAGMKETDKRSCPELIGLHTRAFNLRQDILHRANNPGPLALVPQQALVS